jgi:glucokinase
MKYAIGIDVGGTNIKIAAVTEQGVILSQASIPTDEADGVNTWVTRIGAQIDKITSKQGGPAAWIGVCCPGLPARDGRSIAWMQGRMAVVQDLNWTEYLATGHDIPVVNDAQAALLGECWLGAAAGSKDVMLLTLGTGVGGGALIDGRLLRGHIGRAGHLGHICLDTEKPADIVGTPGSLEDAIGDCTIAQRTGGRYATTADLVAAHRSGDADASTVWLKSVRDLACGIVSLINVLDPKVLIIGGGIAQAGDALFEPLDDYLDEMEWRPTGTRVRIVAAKLGDWAGAYGAAYNAMKEANL